MDKGKAFLGIVAGFAAGALLGILFAPDKGSETRKKIAKSGQEYADALNDTFSKFVEAITEQFESLKDEAEDLAETVKAKASAVKEDAKNRQGKEGV